MVVGASQPTMVGTKDGRIGIKNQMQVRSVLGNIFLKWCLCYSSGWIHFMIFTLEICNMQVNVTADHRVIYGADLASFLQTLVMIIEDPKDLTF